MISRRTFLGLGIAAGGAVLAGAAVASAYATAMADAEARVSSGSSVIPTRFGAMEYAVAGEGPPVLMIHGTGGGFDQGLNFAERLPAMGYQVIAPSRFGYLRSDFPSDPSSANQADAFVDLLDSLKIEEAAAIGGSAGALSAIEFAIRHPDRCSALVALVPATYAPDRPSLQPMGKTQERAMRAMLESDFLFWAATHLARDQMIGTMLATDPALVAAAPPVEKARAERIIRDILPVSMRARGLLNDAVLAGNPARQELTRIIAPTLAISLEDDRFGTYDAAVHIADQVDGARLVSWPTGGHIWVGHDEELFAEIGAFLKSVG
jgi:pimeloyl-ACP methyl ester carboxylesterase